MTAEDTMHERELSRDLVHEIGQAFSEYDRNHGDDLEINVADAVKTPPDDMPTLSVDELHQRVMNDETFGYFGQRNFMCTIDMKRRYLPAQSTDGYLRLKERLSQLPEALQGQLVEYLAGIPLTSMPRLARRISETQILTKTDGSSRPAKILSTDFDEIQEKLRDDYTKAVRAAKRDQVAYPDWDSEECKYGYLRSNSSNGKEGNFTLEAINYLLAAAPGLAEQVISVIDQAMKADIQRERESAAQVLPQVSKTIGALLTGEPLEDLQRGFYESTTLGANWLEEVAGGVEALVSRTRRDMLVNLQTLITEISEAIKLGREFTLERANELGLPDEIVKTLVQIYREGKGAAIHELSTILSSSPKIEHLTVPKEAETDVRAIVEQIKKMFVEGRFLDIFGGINAFLKEVGLDPDLYRNMALKEGFIKEGSPGKPDVKAWMESKDDFQSAREAILTAASLRWLSEASRLLIEGSPLDIGLGMTVKEIHDLAHTRQISWLVNIVGSSNKPTRRDEFELSEAVARQFAGITRLQTELESVPALLQIVDENGMFANALLDVVSHYADPGMTKKEALNWKTSLVAAVLEQDIADSLRQITTRLVEDGNLIYGKDVTSDDRTAIATNLVVEMAKMQQVDDNTGSVTGVVEGNGMYYVVSYPREISRIHPDMQIIVATPNPEIARFYASDIVNEIGVEG